MRPIVCTPIQKIAFLRDTINNENISLLSASVDPFQGAGVIITENMEDVFVRDTDSITFVETEYAQELSWLFYQLRDSLTDVIYYFDKAEFYGRLAEAANIYLIRGEERNGLLMSVLLEASMMAYESLQTKATLIRDEVLSCVGSLSDIAEKI